MRIEKKMIPINFKIRSNLILNEAIDTNDGKVAQNVQPGSAVTFYPTEKTPPRQSNLQKPCLTLTSSGREHSLP